jgi:hypothetical protein
MGSMRPTRRIESTFMPIEREREPISFFDRVSAGKGSLRSAIVLPSDSVGRGMKIKAIPAWSIEHRARARVQTPLSVFYSWFYSRPAYGMPFWNCRVH